MIEWLFLAFMFTLFVLAVRMMSQGWDAAQQLGSGKFVESTTQVKRPPHPEMKDVQPGEELMGVTFDQKTSCSLEEYQALQKRIEELKIELLMEEEDDDEDDDGDIIVRV